MESPDVYNIIIFVTPACSALLMLLMSVRELSNAAGRDIRLVRWLCVFLLLMLLRELFPILYYYAPAIFVYFNWLYFWTLLVVPVLCYRLIFELTRTDPDELFSRRHYMIPCAIALLMFFLLFVVSYDEQYRTVIDRRQQPPGYSFFDIYPDSKVPVKLMFEIFYISASIIRIRQYRKFFAEREPDKNRFSMHPAYQCLLFIGLLALASVLVIFTSRNSFFILPQATAPFFLIAFLQVRLAYRILREPGFPEVTAVEIVDVQENQDPPPTPKKELLTKTFFDEYMRTRKPYLKHNLKITDLVDDLQMNRTYISGFINKEYGMNFNQYINRCRLKEYRRLLADPDMKDKGNEELAELAGFGSYRYFQQLKQAGGKH